VILLACSKKSGRDLVVRNWLPLFIGIYSAGLLYLTITTGVCLVQEGKLGLLAAQNVLILALAIWFIHSGLRDSVLPAFIFGVLYFLLWSIFRYFDLFGDVGGMLGAAGLFFFCAVVMFGFAFYWFKAKKGA
ncbi:MAG: hypothetical protein IJK97_07975, partial [Thermoguttaceae bacterium]|nr:hypothetical protein [Thermoguttaceae bacterium]